MDTNRAEITGRAPHDGNLLAVTVQRACQLSGLGPTSIWALLKDGRLEAVGVPGVRRTLVSFASLERLLAPVSAPRPRSQEHPRSATPAHSTLERKKDEESVTPTGNDGVSR